jgi:prepilin-type N-terminal cleavage/methylation domain-containing protein
MPDATLLPTRRPPPRAFTLIELLVVISVIAVLVSIVLPSLGAARETSRRAKCLANLRSIGQGFSMYLKDSKDRFPRVRPLHDGSGHPTLNDPSLLDLISDYLDAEVPRRSNPDDPESPFIVADPFKCPSDMPGAGRNANTRPVWEETGCSYEYFPGALMLAGEVLLHLHDPAFGVTKAYEKDRHWPVCIDYDDFHHSRRGGPTRNAVYFPDYNADWLIDIRDTQMSSFMRDMVTYSGGPDPAPHE